MDILDTNLWVFGTLGTHDRAAAWLDEIETGERISAISSYMVQEALRAFERVPGLSATARDSFQTEFLTRLTRMDGLVDAPASRDVYPSLLDERRTRTQTQLLARVLDIQPKDVPIVTLAFDHRTREPTILANDAGFAALLPNQHNVHEITIRHVP